MKKFLLIAMIISSIGTMSAQKYFVEIGVGGITLRNKFYYTLPLATDTLDLTVKTKYTSTAPYLKIGYKPNKKMMVFGQLGQLNLESLINMWDTEADTSVTPPDRPVYIPQSMSGLTWGIGLKIWFK